MGCCSDPLELDNYDSSRRISPTKGGMICQSVEHSLVARLNADAIGSHGFGFVRGTP